MKSATKALVLLTALLCIVLALAACDLGVIFGGDVTAAPDTTTTADTTTVMTTTVPPVTTSIGDPTDTSPLTDAEYEAFLSLVDADIVWTAEYAYNVYYIGEFRTVDECAEEIYDIIVNLPAVRAIADVDTATALFVSAYARALGDNYGYYYPPSDYEDYTEDMDGEYTGIGVSVTLLESGYAEILSVFAGSPAEDAGLWPGDILVAVEGEDFAVIGYSDAIDKIRGLVGTDVTITIERDGDRFDVTMTRRRVTEETVSYKMLSGNVGYIRISSFDGTTYTQFVAAHRALDAQGAVSFVFDLRNNPGGTLTSVVSVLEYILPDGDIVTMNYKIDGWDKVIDSIYDINDPDENNVRYMDTRTYCANHAITKPMVVLANGNTASAGELFTSSLRDYEVATVIGEQTFGKGVGQVSFDIGVDGAGLTLTIFSYDPPVQPNYHGIGITPDVSVSLSEEAAKKNLYKLPLEEDAQLLAALEVLGAR